MLKKVIGVISILYGALMMWSSFSAGNGDSSIAPLTLISGIFLFIFDKAYEKSYIDGFNTRNAQRVVMIFLTIIWITMFAVTAFVGIMVLRFGGMFADIREAILSTVAILIPILPGFYIVVLFLKYSKPYKVCRNNFLATEREIAHYLFDKKAYKAYSKNKYVMASEKALFFPRYFCLIPFNQIKSVENKRIIFRRAVFTLKNGKKIKIYTKQYDDIMNAINANS